MLHRAPLSGMSGSTFLSMVSNSGEVPHFALQSAASRGPTLAGSAWQTAAAAATNNPPLLLISQGSTTTTSFPLLFPQSIFLLRRRQLEYQCRVAAKYGSTIWRDGFTVLLSRGAAPQCWCKLPGKSAHTCGLCTRRPYMRSTSPGWCSGQVSQQDGVERVGANRYGMAVSSAVSTVRVRARAGGVKKEFCPGMRRVRPAQLSAGGGRGASQLSLGNPLCGSTCRQEHAAAERVTRMPPQPLAAGLPGPAITWTA